MKYIAVLFKQPNDESKKLVYNLIKSSRDCSYEDIQIQITLEGVKEQPNSMYLCFSAKVHNIVISQFGIPVEKTVKLPGIGQLLPIQQNHDSRQKAFKVLQSLGSKAQKSETKTSEISPEQMKALCVSVLSEIDNSADDQVFFKTVQGKKVAISKTKQHKLNCDTSITFRELAAAYLASEIFDIESFLLVPGDIK